MGLLGKIAAYRWLSNGRSSGGGEGGLAIFFLIILAVVAVVWAVSKVFSFIWGVIYGTVHPILATAPIITIPVSVLLVGLLFTRLQPYPYDAAIAYLDGEEEKLSHTERSVWVIVSIHAIFVFESGILQNVGGLVGSILTLFVALLALYGFFELIHTPYRCTKLLLNAPQGRQYVLLFLTPILTILISSTFNVHLPLPEIGSEPLAMAAGLTVLNGTYFGGPLAVHWNQTHIRRGARERMQAAGDSHTPSDGASHTDD